MAALSIPGLRSNKLESGVVARGWGGGGRGRSGEREEAVGRSKKQGRWEDGKYVKGPMPMRTLKKCSRYILKPLTHERCFFLRLSGKLVSWLASWLAMEPGKQFEEPCQN